MNSDALPHFDANDYAPPVAELLSVERLADLGPGRPDREHLDRLERLTPERALGRAPRDRDMAAACVAGMWLYFDYLDESHTISQSIHTPTGSYWHGIMHRREPDYSNAKYWFRKVGRHPVFEPLAAVAEQLAASANVGREADFLATGADWDPFAFVDLCEAAARKPSATNDLCRQVQLWEWRLLFDWCWRQA